jgi:signal transduction histidine kinase
VCRRSWKWKSASFARSTAFSQAVRKWSQRRVPKTRPLLFEPRRASTASARLVQGHLTPLTAFRNVELDDATGAVHALPGQPEHLATTHPGEERELYQIGQRLGELNEKQEEYLKDIHASGEHLPSLINDILDLSKIEAGRMELELSEFDLPTALDSALTLVRERAGRRGIALHMNVDSRLGQIQADERKVRQVVLNLLPRRRSAHPPR